MEKLVELYEVTEWTTEPAPGGGEYTDVVKATRVLGYVWVPMTCDTGLCERARLYGGHGLGSLSTSWKGPRFRTGRMMS